MIRLYPSKPNHKKKYEQLDFLLTMRARYMNPGVHFDIAEIPIEFRLNDLDDLDRAIEMFFLVNSTGE